jgi:GMP synthase PP-ATPase subunit
VLFLSPSLRGARHAANFLAWCDAQLAAEGVQAVYHHIKAAHNVGPLFERMGYTLVDLVYGKRLD